MKIAYCINSISHVGGIERVTIAKANALAAIPGNEVWIAYTDINPSRPGPALALDSRVRTIDLGIRYYADDRRGLLWRLRGNTLLRRRHRKALQRALASIAPDIVVSVGHSEKYFLPSLHLPGRPAFVRELHFSHDYRRRNARGLVSRMIARANDFYDYRLQMPRYDAVAVLTQEDMDAFWSRLPMAARTHVIPNPVTSSTACRADMSQKEVITVGRLSYPKNHASLLRAWSKVVERNPDWHLTICGGGELEADLRTQIAETHLDRHVTLAGNVDNVLARMAKASIFAFSSRFEGMPLVLIEAASVGLPSVAYACQYGPRDIISDGHTGLLVPTGDEDALAGALCRLIDSPDERRRMGEAAVVTARRYAPDAIARQWMELFSQLRPGK